MSLPKDAKKGYDIFQHTFMIKKIVNKLRIEGNYIYIIKAIREKPMLSVMLDGGLAAFP